MKSFRVNGLIRISKYNAKLRYNRGETIYICPLKVRPGGPWHPESMIAKDEADGDAQVFMAYSKDFDDVVREYEHYNCNHYSVGRYPAYYIKEGSN